MDTAAPPAAETWNLDDLFADEAQFEAELRRLADSVPDLARWRGRLAGSAAVVAEALAESTEALKRLARLRCYASLKSDADIRVAAHQAMRQRVELLATEMSAAISYLGPELLELGPETLEGYIEGEPRLAPYAFYLRDLLRRREHVLGPAEERIMAAASLMSNSPGSLYQVFHNVDLPRPEVTLRDGSTVRLTPVAFRQHRSTADRDDRVRLFSAFFGAYDRFKDTLAHNLFSGVKTQMFRARARGHASCVAAALFHDHVPVEVYRRLIEQVHEQLPLLHRYLKLCAAKLGVERLEYSDVYCPLSDAPPATFSPEQARRQVLAAVAPIGAEYAGALEQAFRDRWIDWHPAPGKRSGAYATGWAYDVHPYVLLNYTGEFESLTTLAHEIGHAMHSFFSNRAQPFATANYSIFVAEVASTLNEALLSRLMLSQAPDDETRLFLLGRHLDGIRGTLFRQAMFAEFELTIHERAERGEALTSDRLSEIYLELLRTYHGHDRGVMRIDDAFAIEWAAIPHFYYDFYVYQYATGIVAATALAETLVEGNGEAARRYLEFLSAGGSDYPLALLRAAGVDLESRDPYALAFASVRRHLDRLAGLLEPATSN